FLCREFTCQNVIMAARFAESGTRKSSSSLLGNNSIPPLLFLTHIGHSSPSVMGHD
ncbi:hypothetical protein MKX03_022300, partial [Papaver bracteatum]